ncbi:MAG: response regulator [Nitrospirae bacterium]|nr:response regulator [Nitrospirota bacterium]
MPTNLSILLIDDSPGECELFRLALVKTGLDVALYTEQDAEAAFHFLEDRYHQSSFQARSFPPSEGGLNWSPTARIEGAHSDCGASASKGEQSGLPSIILLDWHLQKTRGDQFLTRLRSDARFASIPVVVFTTSDKSSDLASAYANGANGFVVKPGMFDDLVRFVGDLCSFWLKWNRTSEALVRC